MYLYVLMAITGTTTLGIVLVTFMVYRIWVVTSDTFEMQRAPHIVKWIGDSGLHLHQLDTQDKPEAAGPSSSGQRDPDMTRASTPPLFDSSDEEDN